MLTSLIILADLRSMMHKLLPFSMLLLWLFSSCGTSTRSTISGSVTSDSDRVTSANLDTAQSAVFPSAAKSTDTLKGEDRFIGRWGRDATAEICHYIEIDEDTSLFAVACNQLGVMCRNKYRGDTLLLYVIETDQGRGFMGPKYHPPKPGSLFAKCYTIDTMLKIIYTQKMYSENIADLELDTVLIKYRE
jgi:hypothetical protein